MKKFNVSNSETYNEKQNLPLPCYANPMMTMLYTNYCVRHLCKTSDPVDAMN